MKRRNLSTDEQKLWQRLTQDIDRLAKSDQFINDPKPFPKTIRRIYIQPIIPTKNLSVAVLSEREIKSLHLDSRLDLHGYTLERATTALEQFLIAAQQRQHRWILIITGKGEQGILKTFVPMWLGQNPQWVIGYTTARPKHGGEGALYVRIRRLR